MFKQKYEASQSSLDNFLSIDPPIFVQEKFLLESEMEWLMIYIQENLHLFEKEKESGLLFLILDDLPQPTILTSIKEKIIELSGILLIIVVLSNSVGVEIEMFDKIRVLTFLDFSLTSHVIL